MKFKIDSDEGVKITGWLIPDDRAGPSSVLVVADDAIQIEAKACIHRPELQKAGLHANGMVGFEVSDRDLPGLAAYANLEIKDLRTGFLIYRRPDADRHLSRRVIYIDPSPFPQVELWRAMRANFTLAYHGIERFSEETILSLIHADHPSLILHGRLNLRKYRDVLIAHNFLIVVTLAEPVTVLAEMILYLKAIERLSGGNAPTALPADLSHIAAFAMNADMNDRGRLSQAFRHSTQEARNGMRSPMTQLFACAANERPTDGHVSIALENLATCALVGVRSQFDSFRATLGHFLSRDICEGLQMREYPIVASAVRELSRVGLVQGLLELDATLYAAVLEAIDHARGEEMTIEGSTGKA